MAIPEAWKETPNLNYFESLQGAYINGATWANDQNAKEIARLEAEKAELIAFILEIGKPKRGSEAEGWTIHDVAHHAIKLLKKYEQ